MKAVTGTVAYPLCASNGGGTATRDEAERECLAAIAMALQGDPGDYDTAAEVLTFDVRIERAAGLTVERADELIADITAGRDAHP